MLVYKFAKTCDAFGKARVLQKKVTQKEMKRDACVRISGQFGNILESLVFVAQKPRVNLSLVLGRDTMTIQPRFSSWSAKDVGKIPGPLPM